MQLSPGQLSTLTEMGIPVWEYRQLSPIPTETVTVEPSIQSTETDEQIIRCDWLVLIDQSDNNQQTQRLLQAMMSAVGVLQHQFAIVRYDQLSQLHTLPIDRKVVMALGHKSAQLLLGEKVLIEDCRGKAFQAAASKLTTIVSFSLSELIQTPQKKALAWQDIQFAKSIHQRSGHTE
ncbi:MAG: hypothetical protein OEY48_01445 [Gammaproteobacteria bacterium]|nr:hypothetical protein [Gammaproteobacteria bacterium]MDH5591495.1 hypothetical protein [Gammaproteobacteria bacterium]